MYLCYEFMDQDTYKAFQVESPYVGKYLRVRFSYYSGLVFFTITRSQKNVMMWLFQKKPIMVKTFI